MEDGGDAAGTANSSSFLFFLQTLPRKGILKSDRP